MSSIALRNPLDNAIGKVDELLALLSAKLPTGTASTYTGEVWTLDSLGIAPLFAYLLIDPTSSRDMHETVQRLQQSRAPLLSHHQSNLRQDCMLHRPQIKSLLNSSGSSSPKRRRKLQRLQQQALNQPQVGTVSSIGRSSR